MLILSLGLLIFAFTIYAIGKQYQTTLVLFLSGIALWTLAFSLDAHFYTAKNFQSTGLHALDTVAMFTSLCANSISSVGLIIMAAGGFAAYMNAIGACGIFVRIVSKPLMFIKNPYILIAVTVVFIQIMGLFIPSATGLAMLLLVTLLPLLQKLNVSPASAAAVLASSVCLELGPASGTTSVVAQLSGITPMTYFMHNQLLAAVVSILVLAVLYFFSSIYFDKKDKAQLAQKDYPIKVAPPVASTIEQEKNLPSFYAILPATPMVLLVIFSDYVINDVELDVATTMFFAFLLAMFCELVRTRNLSQTLDTGTAFFTGMADMLKNVVMLLVAAQFFASGLQAVGIAHYLLEIAEIAGFGMLGMTILLVAIIGILTMVSGSGSAFFLSFSELAPTVAGKMSESPLSILLPMQTAAGTFRSMSPVAGLVVAISNGAGISPLTVVKRTAIPMLGAIIANIIVASFF